MVRNRPYTVRNPLYLWSHIELQRYFSLNKLLSPLNRAAIFKQTKKLLGPDTGFDSIGDYSQTKSISGYLNKLDETDELPKTII